MAQSEEHSPGKRKVPVRNPGRSLCHFFSSVISQSSLSFFQKKVRRLATRSWFCPIKQRWTKVRTISKGQNDWMLVLRYMQERQLNCSSCCGLYILNTRETAARELFLVDDFLPKKSQSFKAMLSKKVPQKRTESNASCMIEQPGCPEPRAQAVITQSVY